MTAAELSAAREAARSVDEIMRAEARIAWAKAHDGAACPRDRIPSLADLGAWLDTTDAAEFRRAGFLWLPDVRPYPGEADGPAGMLLCPMDGAMPNGPPARRMITVDQASAVWRSLREAATMSGEVPPAHPLSALVAAWQGRPVAEADARAVVLRRGSDLWARAPGIAAAALLSPVEAVAVDGVPLASRAPAGSKLFRRIRAPASAAQGRLLDPAPRTLDGAAVDPVLAVLSRGDWTADPRSPLRSDVHDLVKLGCALTRPVRLPIETIARWVSRTDGRIRPEVVARAETAVAMGALIVFHGRTALQMVRAMTEAGDVVIHPADWFNGGRGAGAWRLSGALWRGRWASAKQGGHRRMAEGIEAAIAWSAPAGGRSRLPELLRPIRPGGPGPDVLVDWRRVIYLSGEPYPGEDDPAERRYRRRVADFIEAGYRAHGSAAAPAGDTWEIVEPKRGALVIRASARYCAAVAAAQCGAAFEAVPLDRLLYPERPR